MESLRVLAFEGSMGFICSSYVFVCECTHSSSWRSCTWAVNMIVSAPASFVGI